MARLSVTLVKSPIGYRPQSRATIRALGLRRINQTVEVADNESVRGMLAAVPYLVRVEAAGTTSRATKKEPTVVVSRAAQPEAAAAVEAPPAPKPKTTRTRSRRTAEADEQPAGEMTATGEPTIEDEPEKPAPRARRKSAAGTSEALPEAEANVGVGETAESPQVEPVEPPAATEATVEATAAEEGAS